MKEPVSCSSAVVLVLSLVALPAAAQTTFGSITGTVSDQTGAPSATVTVINEGTGVEHKVQTKDTGVFNAHT